MTQKIHKNIYSSLHNGGRITARKGVSNRGVLTTGSKILNRAEKSEHRNQNLGTRPCLISTPVTQ